MTNALLTPTKIDAIDPAFNDPPESAHGGPTCYGCGDVALAGPEHSVVTGELAVSIPHPITGSREYQIQSQATSQDGRKIRTEDVLVDSDDGVLGTALATWITIPSTRNADQ